MWSGATVRLTQERDDGAIDTGVVAGSIVDGIASFKGIPYAEPAVGPMRWRAPQPVTTWDGIRWATEYGIGMDGPAFGPDPRADRIKLTERARSGG